MAYDLTEVIELLDNKDIDEILEAAQELGTIISTMDPNDENDIENMSDDIARIKHWAKHFGVPKQLYKSVLDHCMENHDEIGEEI